MGTICFILCFSIAFAGNNNENKTKPSAATTDTTKLKAAAADVELVQTCNARCLFSRCSASCAGYGDAICRCQRGFARCECGGTKESHANNVSPGDLTKMHELAVFLEGMGTPGTIKAGNSVRAAARIIESKSVQAYEGAVDRVIKDIDALPSEQKEKVRSWLVANGEYDF